MDRQRVLDALEVLRAELAGAEQVSGEARAALERVSDDIRQLLAKPQSAAPSAESSASDEAALTGLREALLEFEAEHPQITGAVNQVAAALANIGI